MTDSDRSEPTQADESSNKGRRDLLIGGVGFVLFVLVSFVAMMFFSGNARGMLLLGKRPSGETAIDLRILHTQDTWGYLAATG